MSKLPRFLNAQALQQYQTSTNHQMDFVDGWRARLIVAARIFDEFALWPAW
jgi:hypothetical protein